MASLCDGAVYYGELTHQRGLGEETDDGQLEEDFHQVGGGWLLGENWNDGVVCSIESNQVVSLGFRFFMSLVQVLA